MNTDGGGWTVFQRRVNGRESFWNRSWNDFKNGFSSFKQNSNFWLGNELLHQLTAKDPNVTLMVEMNGDRTPGAIQPNAYWWNQYTMFQVGPESENYTLRNLNINWKSMHGNASTGWYDITSSVGAAFSTVDRINDPEPKCVTQFKMGGWWLRYCTFATLNGEYDISKYTNGYGMFWIVNGLNYIIHPRKTTMKLRPFRTQITFSRRH
uniref:Fibrinogen C-terminal domain-containing protein n=1 Tax=Angiostrongylus cantonensis TaxID=6313 RepID=A0A0K0DBG8_ANGCA